MFQVGALDPRVGNDRRNQLLQKLMQQYMQQQGMGTPGQPALPTNLMHSTPAVAGTATRPADVPRMGGRPEFTFADFIPPGLLPALGPGGVGRAPQSAMSPQPGIPVPGIGHGPAGGGIPGPPAGTPIGTGPDPTHTPASGTGPAPTITPATGTGPNPTYTPPATGTGPAPVHTTPSGAIPLGNGIFLHPDGTISGSATGIPMGGAARAV